VALAKKSANLTLHALEVTNHAAIEALAKKLGDITLDVLINNAGIFGPSGFDGEGQNFEGMDYALWRQAFETNTLAPYKMTQAFAPHLARGKNKCVVMLSTRMASLSGMKEAGMLSTAYQSSKAALNMAAITLSQELKAQEITVLMLHPGWVRTDMGGEEAPLEAKDSVTSMRKVIASARLKDTGSFRDYQGKALAW
jgi:NAD(P)-dependent dehydrogenase (short-subunit alcohol dehydrogenase family)